MWIKYYGHGFTHYTILLYTINFITWRILENTFIKHDNNYFFEITFSSYRPKSSGVGDAFVLGVSKKEMLVRQELIAVNRFLCCRGLPIIGPTDKVQVFRRGVANGSIFSSAKMAKSKLKNSYNHSLWGCQWKNSVWGNSEVFSYSKPPCCISNKASPKWIPDLRHQIFLRIIK